MVNRAITKDHLISREEALSMKLCGSQMLVERYRPPSKLTPDSLIVLPYEFMSVRGVGMTSTHDDPRMLILAVGPGEVLDDGTREDMPKVGDVAIADNVWTDERNLISKDSDDDYCGIYVAHVMQIEAIVESNG